MIGVIRRFIRWWRVRNRKRYVAQVFVRWSDAASWDDSPGPQSFRRVFEDLEQEVFGDLICYREEE